MAMNKQTIYGILNDAEGFSISDGTADKCTTFWKGIFALLKGKEESEQEFLLGSIMSFVNKDGLNQIVKPPIVEPITNTRSVEKKK